jgi:hypothetical protein
VQSTKGKQKELTMSVVQEDHPPGTAADASKQSRITWKKVALLFSFLILFPIVPLILSVAMGGLLAWVEGIVFSNGFLYGASNLLSMNTSLTEFNPANALGSTIDLCVSVEALLLFAIVINIVNIFQLPYAINQGIG